tara:strand:- start:352 stop:705 length:354 start_codon:yes stop_codon:yes gene_type:complete
MALGNSNASAKARGKNVGAKRRRRREMIAAANFTEYVSGTKKPDHIACCAGTHSGATFFHNGSSAYPTTNDIVYEEKRARNPNSFVAGFYKIDGGGGRFKTLNINTSGVVTGTANCP